MDAPERNIGKRLYVEYSRLSGDKRAVSARKAAFESKIGGDLFLSRRNVKTQHACFHEIQIIFDLAGFDNELFSGKIDLVQL
jgi:hypothetical protein